MAITEERRVLELPAGETADERPGPLGVFSRPRATTGWKSWFTTVDHKKIGILYGATAMLFFVAGGIEALIIRLQLASPNGGVVDEAAYNGLFTMHGTTMIFLVVMPLSAAFANYLLPLQIGARDVAFPRLNAFSYWVFLFGGLFLYSSVFLGGAPDCGWFCYSPNSGVAYSPGHGVDFWVLGIQITGIASLVGAVNLIVTVINLRAPGMSLMKMPIFTWMALVVQFLLLFAIPVITVALFLLMFDRLFGANFFDVSQGADPLLWQHLFWIFGHPEVYILVLPAFGIVSEVLPVFSRKPLFGYPFVVFSGIAIGFMGWGVWAHHMFASGIGPVSVAAFSLSTMFIAVPTGVKIFNWLGTVWRGKLSFDTPMLFALGLVGLFTIGGLSGVTHAVSPSDWQQTDTYYIVAHFHYVLFAGALFGLFAGVYYWWPKAFGYALRESLGKTHFWLMFIGGNLTFGPMHIFGLQGMPRRVATYPEDMGWDTWNMVATIGSFIIALSMLVWIVNVVVSHRNRAAQATGHDPWDGRTLEWSIPSPPPEYNFAHVPTVSRLDEYWFHKYREDDAGHLVRADTGEVVTSVDEHVESVDEHDAHDAGASEEHDGVHDIHLPSPSYWPIVMALGLPLIAYGLIYTYFLAVLGALLVIGGIYGLGLEPSVEPGDAHGAEPAGPEPAEGPRPEQIEAAEPADDEGAAGEPATVGGTEDS